MSLSYINPLKGVKTIHICFEIQLAEHDIVFRGRSMNYERTKHLGKQFSGEHTLVYAIFIFFFQT